MHVAELTVLKMYVYKIGKNYIFAARKLTDLDIFRVLSINKMRYFLNNSR